MAEQILDGTGTGKKVKVDNGNRLHTHSVIESMTEFSASNGDSYNFNTGTINLTTGNESSVAYIKNNSDNELHISSVGYLLGASTGGSGDVHTTIVKNPTTGTTISNANDVDIFQNKNVGSSKVVTVDAYKGAEGETITDGTDLYYSLIAGSARGYVINTGTISIPKGGSIGIKITPQSGNTSMDLQIFISLIEYNLD